MIFSTKIIHHTRYVFICLHSCSLDVLITKLTFPQVFVFIWRQISGGCSTTPSCSPTLPSAASVSQVFFCSSPPYVSHCWSFFQLYLHLWFCGPFSWIVAGDRIQCLLPFSAFFTFTITLMLLERAGNHSSTDQNTRWFNRRIIWHPQHQDYICNLCAELLCSSWQILPAPGWVPKSLEELQQGTSPASHGLVCPTSCRKPCKC